MNIVVSRAPRSLSTIILILQKGSVAPAGATAGGQATGPFQPLGPCGEPLQQ